MDGDVNQEAWKAGAASVAITPEEAMWLAGWAVRRQPACSAAMKLSAKALAIQDPQGDRLVIVSADLIAIPRSLAQTVASEILSRWNLPRQRLLFNASHTHNGPEIRPDKVPFFDIPAEFAARIEPYVLELVQKIVAVIGEALTKLEPAKLRFHRANIGFAQNRRSPNGPVDHAVPILSFADRHDKLIAVLFGYACHNLALPPEHLQFHGDYAGVAQVELEAKFPGAVALFLSGAGADQEPSPRATLECATTHGRSLAAAVVKSLANHSHPIEGSLGVGFEEIELPLQPFPNVEILKNDRMSSDAPLALKARFLLAQVEGGVKLVGQVRCPVQVIRFGPDVLMIALGGEPVVDYALKFKSRFASEVWVVGYSNDLFGYLPTKRILKEGGYEGGRATLWSALPAPLAESAEDLVTEATDRLVQDTA